MFPPLPDWDGLHPLVVHFPIALLMTAPLLVIASLVWRRYRLPIGTCALVVMALGASGAFLAVATGEAAEEAAERIAAAKPVLEQHEELAERVRIYFAVLTAAYALVLFNPLAKKPLEPLVPIAAGVVFLLIYVGGLLLLAHTAHYGGRLVHEFGVHAPVVSGAVLGGTGKVEDDD